MTSRPLALPTLLALTLLLTVVLSACTTETVEVTRIKILERRVIERIVVTVEVTRIHRLMETPRPTADDLVPPQAGATDQAAPGTPSVTGAATPAGETATPAPPRPTAAATATPARSTKQLGEFLLAAMKDTEQTLLALQQALNSNPLPTGTLIELYDTLRSAPTLAVPEGETELESIYARYREQIDYAVGQATDIYNHAVDIQSGEAAQTDISPTHLSLAQSAASASTSAVQGLIRELETYLASQP